MMLQSVLKPIILRLKPDQDASGLPVTCDHNLLRSREPQVARQIILNLGQRNLTAILR